MSVEILTTALTRAVRGKSDVNVPPDSKRADLLEMAKVLRHADKQGDLNVADLIDLAEKVLRLAEEQGIDINVLISAAKRRRSLK